MECFPIVMPHAIMRYLFDTVKIEVDGDQIKTFWQHAKSVRAGWAAAADDDRIIPLGLHGDAAQLWTRYKKEKILCITVNVLHFRPRSVRWSRFALFTIDHAKLYKNRTISAVLRHLVRSFNSMFHGLDAKTGERLTRAGHRFMLCQLRGDWEWFRDLFRWNCGWNSANVCFQCPASSTGDLGNLFAHSGSAREPVPCIWIDNMFNNDQFISLRLRDQNLCNLYEFMSWSIY